jgi:hypothetical protein
MRIYRNRMTLSEARINFYDPYAFFQIVQETNGMNRH